MYKDLSKWSLLSVGKLCDAGVTAIFTSGTVEAFLEGRVVLKGSVHRQQTNGLYMVDLNPEDEQGVSNGQALNVFSMEQSKSWWYFTTASFVRQISQPFFSWNWT